jgi:hypothetical protein
LATAMSRRSLVFALVGIVALVFLLAGHYSYNNSSDSMFDLLTSPPPGR